MFWQAGCREERRGVGGENCHSEVCKETGLSTMSKIEYTGA